MTVTVLCIIAISHWLSDFVFQSKKSLNKYNSYMWLTIHVLMYMAAFSVISGILLLLAGVGLGAWFLVWIIVNGVLHWTTDFCTSKINTPHLNSNNTKAMMIVGFDHLVHLITLIVSYQLLMA